MYSLPRDLVPHHWVIYTYHGHTGSLRSARGRDRGWGGAAVRMWAMLLSLFLVSSEFRLITHIDCDSGNQAKIVNSFISGFLPL
jgi:hypothetical protein